MNVGIDIYNPDEALINRYQGNIPRYTSYPTAAEFREFKVNENAETAFRSVLGSKENAKISLYVHLPFCPSLCYFCACNKIISTDPGRNKEYLQLLRTELKLLRDTANSDHSVVQVHLGGGSPSYLETFDLLKLDEILHTFRISEDCKKSIEIDPRTFDSEKLNILYELGYRRYSIGVQDFDPEVQKIINRIQPYSMTADLVKEIRTYRNNSINLDLIYGLPGQTNAGFNNTVEKVIELLPDRIALYGYAHVNWKTKVQNVFNKHATPSPSERIGFFMQAVSQLTKAGYVYIGLDHFALPEDELTIALNNGTLRRNFMGYTTVAGDYLIGCGVSAISELEIEIIQNAVNLDDYKQKLLNGELPAAKKIFRFNEDQIRSYAIEQLMCNRKLDLTSLQTKFANYILCSQIFESACEKLKQIESDGLITIVNKTIQIRPKGYFFLRQIASAFDAYLDGHTSEKPKFSAAI